MSLFFQSIISTVSGAEEFAYLLGTCLCNYGSIITIGIYDHHVSGASTKDTRLSGLESSKPCQDNSGRSLDRPQNASSEDGPQGSNTAGRATPAESQPERSNHGPSGNPKPLKVHTEIQNKNNEEKVDEHEAQLRDTIRGMKVDTESDDSVLDFAEISGLESVRLALEEFGCFFLHFPHLTRNLRQRSTTGILLFGPQGTGKTLLIRSFARKFNLTLFDIRASAVMSKFVGESEKFIKALFKEVRSSAPAVLMLDECDGLLCNPASDMTQSHSYRLLQNELKNQWSDLIYSRDEVIVIGATNKPHDIDMDGFGRRLSLKLHVDLPDEAGCRAMMKRALVRVRHVLSQEETDILGTLCWEKRLSGFDIDCLVEAQLRRAIRSITTASHFREMQWEGGTVLVPCGSGGEGIHQGPWTRLGGDSEKLSYTPFTFEDILGAVERARPTVDESMAQRHATFAEQYGTT